MGQPGGHCAVAVLRHKVVETNSPANSARFIGSAPSATSELWATLDYTGAIFSQSTVSRRRAVAARFRLCERANGRVARRRPDPARTERVQPPSLAMARARAGRVLHRSR